MLKLLAFTLPLCLDTFAVSFGVLGEMRLTRAQRIRVAALLIAFEAGMPLVGMALGAPLTHLAGSPAHVYIDPYQVGSPAEAYQLGKVDRTHLADTVDLTFVGRYILPIVVPVVLGALGILMLDESLNDDDDDDDDEAGKVRALVSARGLSVIGLGIATSVDDLVIGFTLAFHNLPVHDIFTAIVIQAFLAVVVGQFIGWQVRTERLRLNAERIASFSQLAAGAMMVVVAAIVLLTPEITAHVIPHIFPHHRYIPPR